MLEARFTYQQFVLSIDEYKKKTLSKKLKTQQFKY